MTFCLSLPRRFLVVLALLTGLSAAGAAIADHHEGASTAEQAPTPLIMRYREGEHYQRVPIAKPSRGDDIEVVEYFSYGCVHCFNFDPVVETWAAEPKPGVKFTRTPAVFNRSWEFLAQAFYAAEVLGVSEELHQPLFRAIHTDNINIGNPALMTKLFTDHSAVSADDFAQAFDSFSVRSKVQQSKAQGRSLRLRAVPSMVVGGQYVVDGSMLKGGNEEMLEVVDYLVGLLKSERTMLEAAAGD
ncbi:MAG: thiol:disulfide interchange protein DsbA/DsbL [Pseudomonadota bacterium]